MPVRQLPTGMVTPPSGLGRDAAFRTGEVLDQEQLMLAARTPGTARCGCGCRSTSTSTAVFGHIQARDGEGVQRGWIRVVGLVSTAIMTTFAIVHYNLRMVRKWAKRIGFQSDDILLARDRAIAGYEEIPLDDDEPRAALSPPAAA